MRLFRILFAVLLAGVAVQSNAQDILTKQDGTKMTVKVLVVSPSGIKYRDYDNEDGRIYTLPASEVYSIKYADGIVNYYNGAIAVTQFFADGEDKHITYTGNYWSGRKIAYNGVEVGIWDVGKLLKSDTQAHRKWVLSQVLYGTSYALSFVGGYMLGYGLTGKQPEMRKMGCIGIALGLGGGLITARTQVRAIDTFNNNVDNKGLTSSIQLGFGATSDGIGLTLYF